MSAQHAADARAKDCDNLKKVGTLTNKGEVQWDSNLKFKSFALQVIQPPPGERILGNNPKTIQSYELIFEGIPR